MKRFNLGIREKQIIFSEPSLIRFSEGCRHSIVICNGETSLLPPSSSIIGTCTCIECGDTFNTEIRHMDYVCKDGKLNSFKSMFDYDKPYTEYDIVETLIKNIKPKYIIKGRRLLYGVPVYHDTYGKQLHSMDNVIWAYTHKIDGAVLIPGVFIDGYVFGIYNNRLVIRTPKNIVSENCYLKYIMIDKEKRYNTDLFDSILESKRVITSIKEELLNRGDK